jgi:hypothetical protein
MVSSAAHPDRPVISPGVFQLLVHDAVEEYYRGRLGLEWVFILECSPIPSVNRRL